MSQEPSHRKRNAVTGSTEQRRGPVVFNEPLAFSTGWQVRVLAVWIAVWITNGPVTAKVVFFSPLTNNLNLPGFLRPPSWFLVC